MTLHASAAVDLDVQLADLRERSVETLGRVGAIEQAIRRPPAQPFTAQLADSDVMPASGDLVLDLGGPMQGREWDLRTLVVGGLTYATVAAGTALVVVAAQTPVSAAAVGIAGVVDQAASLPLPAGYGEGQIRIKNPERFFVIVVGGTAAQVYVAAARITEYQQAVRIQTAQV